MFSFFNFTTTTEFFKSPHPNPSRSSTALSPPGHVRRTRSLVFFEDLATEQERNPESSKKSRTANETPRERQREREREEVKHFITVILSLFPSTSRVPSETCQSGGCYLAVAVPVLPACPESKSSGTHQAIQICKLVACGSKAMRSVGCSCQALALQ